VHERAAASGKALISMKDRAFIPLLQQQNALILPKLDLITSAFLPLSRGVL
jgi:hypothetical protein